MKNRSGSAVSPLMRELSEFISAAPRKALPAKVVEAAKLELVDTFAAMVSGTRLLPGIRALAFIKSQGGLHEASVVGTRIRTSALNAALANGMSAHADETDSGHSPTLCHISASVVPAALAIAERDNLGGRALLRAIAVGFDVGTRVLLSFGSTRLLRAGHHAAAIGQLFGAAATSCALLKLNPRQVRHALSYTAEQTAGLFTMFRDPEHIEKAFGMGGMPARNGLGAALMVTYGFTGTEDVFSGERDFFYTFGHGESVKRDELVRGLCKDYEILRSSIKRWPVGGPIQGPLNVLLELMREHRFGARDVEAIEARVPDTEADIVNDRDMPEISLQQMLATMLTDGTVTFASAHDFARMRDKKLVALRQRVSVVGDPMFNKFPRAWCCKLEVKLRNGQVLSGKTMASKGSYLNPLTRSEEEEKALDLMGPILGKIKTRRLLDILWQIDKLETVKNIGAYAR